MSKPQYQKVPKQIELFGRVVKTFFDAEKLGIRGVYGEARYGQNEIGINPKMQSGAAVSDDEIKLTYLHEMMHFILNFTGLEKQLHDSQFDVEQFIELLASGIYQYEKSAKY